MAEGMEPSFVIVAFNGDVQGTEPHAADKAGIAAFENLSGFHQAVDLPHKLSSGFLRPVFAGKHSLHRAFAQGEIAFAGAQGFFQGAPKRLEPGFFDKPPKAGQLLFAGGAVSFLTISVQKGLRVGLIGLRQRANQLGQLPQTCSDGYGVSAESHHAGIEGKERLSIPEEISLMEVFLEDAFLMHCGE